MRFCLRPAAACLLAILPLAAHAQDPTHTYSILSGSAQTYTGTGPFPFFDIDSPGAWGISIQLAEPGLVVTDATDAIALRITNIQSADVTNRQILSFDATGPISTTADGSAGIHIQTAAAAVPGQGPSSSYLDTFYITHLGAITTSGDAAHGMFIEAQVLANGTTANAAVNGVVVYAENITTTGTRSHAIFVEATTTANGSAAATATAAWISASISGAVAANGADAHALNLVTSPTGTPNALLVEGRVSVDVSDGASLAGGTGQGRAIYIPQADHVSITNYANGSISALSNTAIEATGNTAELNNHGQIAGNVTLLAQGAAFINHEGATYVTHTAVTLGSDGTLENAGRMTLGGDGIATTTEIAGNFHQVASGSLAYDADWTGVSDRLTVYGTATIAGTLIVLPHNFPTTPGGTQFLVLSASQGITDQGLTVEDSAAADYELTLDDTGTALYLSATINFLGLNPDFALNRNQTAIATTLNSILMHDPPTTIPAFTPALIALPTEEGLAAALDQLSPDVYNKQRIETLYAAQQWGRDVLSCHDKTVRYDREGPCLWAQARTRELDMDSTTEMIGAGASTHTVAGGIQISLAPGWFLGGGAAFENVNLSTASRAKADGERYNLGAALKYAPGPFSFAAALTAGRSHFDTTRHVSFGDPLTQTMFSESPEGNSNIDYTALTLNTSYRFAFGSNYLKPLLEASVTHLRFDSLSERNGGGAELNVQSKHDTLFTLSPALEAGTTIATDFGLWRPFIKAGVTWRTEDRLALSASFAEDILNTRISNTAVLDDVMFDLTAGLNIALPRSTNVRLQYSGIFGKNQDSHGAALSAAIHF